MKLLYSILLACLFLGLVFGSDLDNSNDFEESRHDKGPSSYITSCGNATDILSLQSSEFDPSLVIKGENLHFEATGTLSEAIQTGAYAKVKVKFGILTVVKKTIDLCQEMSVINKACPLKKGPFQISHVFQVPADIPRGKFKFNVEAYTVDNQKVTCLQGVIKVASPSKARL